MKNNLAKEPALQHKTDMGEGGAPACANAIVVAAPAPATARLVELSTLLDGNDRMYIVHGGKKYCLRITAQNKLILTA